MSELNFLDTGGNKQKITTPVVNSIAFNTANTERVRIDSSGRVLIGTTDTHGSDADDLVVATSGTTGITIRSGTSGSGNIYFADGNSGTSLYRGRVSYYHGDDSLFLGTANANNSLKIHSNGIITKPNTPAFHVSRQGGDVGSNNYVTFDHVDYNNGNHYSNSTGRFTAPVTGIYFFSAWHFTGSTSAFYLRINGTTYGEYTWDDTGGCGTWVCPMTAGQYAQIYTRSYTWRGTSDYHNGFNGFLIG